MGFSATLVSGEVIDLKAILKFVIKIVVYIILFLTAYFELQIYDLKIYKKRMITEMKDRYFGLDFMRILIMYMVVILHVLKAGGILGNTEIQGKQYWVAWCMEISAYCAVNCFGLLSGYVMHDKKAKISQCAKLWCQIFFYTIGITLFMFFYFPDTRTFTNIKNALFPITTYQYWYLSAYFGMYFFVPIMNIAIEKIEKQEARKLLGLGFIMYCILPTFMISDPYNTLKGFSTIWLCFLYLLGAYLGKYHVLQTVWKKRVDIFIFLSAVLVTVVFKFIIGHIDNLAQYNDIFISYTSPTIIISAISLFSFCLKLQFSHRMKNMIKTISPAVLGIYIIHFHPLIRSYFLEGFSISFSNNPCILMVGQVLGSALAIFSSCLIVDLIRIKLFKILRINKLCVILEEKIRRF